MQFIQELKWWKETRPRTLWKWAKRTFSIEEFKRTAVLAPSGQEMDRLNGFIYIQALRLIVCYAAGLIRYTTKAIFSLWFCSGIFTIFLIRPRQTLAWVARRERRTSGRRQSCKETCWLLLLHSLSALAHIVSFTILSLNLLLASELWCTACLFCLRTDMPTPTLHATFSDYQAGAENLHKLVSVTQRLAAAQFTLCFWFFLQSCMSSLDYTREWLIPGPQNLTFCHSRQWRCLHLYQ